MYVIGKGHEHEGPGTSMVQRINWTREQENQLRLANRHGMGYVPEFLPDYQLLTMGRGLGCGSCSSCSGCKKGMGLFDTGLDLSGWSWPEYGIAAFIAYSVFSTSSRGARRVKSAAAGAYRGARAGSRKAA
jgi:hypothetical protein